MAERTTLAESFDAQRNSYVTEREFSSTYMQCPPLDPILSPRISSKQFRVHCQSVLDEHMHFCINKPQRGYRRIKAATLVKMLQ